MAEGYPELRGQGGATEKRIIEEVQAEENGFDAQLKIGLELIKQKLLEVRREGKRLFPGDFAFRLHDTNGLPLDLTQAVLRDQGFEVDLEEFDRLMDEQRDRSRASRKESIAGPEIQVSGRLQTRFVGYDRAEADSEVTDTFRGDLSPDTTDELTRLLVRETPFYPEGGGQIGDRGVIEAAGGGALFEVTETRKSNEAIVHIGRLLRGDAREFAAGARVHLKIDRNRRRAAMLNHSATHVLHYALREVFGDGVHQAGSLVAPEKLRFDFNYTGKIADADLQTIEEEVNARIRENAEVLSEEMAYDDAIKAGALAFFGDKYGDRVRVLRIGDFSVELCGGTHVARTGEIGVFRLDSESGIAAGVRRIEALTGQGAVESIRAHERILDEIGNQLRAKDALALERLQRLLAREKELERKIRELEKKLLAGPSESAGADGDQVRQVNGIKLVTRKLDGVDPSAMREMADRLRQKHGSAVIALGSDLGEKVALLVAVTPDLANRVKAGEIVKQIAPIVGGSGGGRPDLAQAGGRDASRLAQALDQVANLLG
jgi:alanyl-tRNA synthetase